MKTAVRFFALSVVVAGAVAAAVPSSHKAIVPSKLAVSAAIPMPGCSPTIPCQPSLSVK